MNDVNRHHDGGIATIVYILYLVGIASGVTILIGVILAYTNRKKDAVDWVGTHYQFQIRTFWIGLLYSTIVLILFVSLAAILIEPYNSTSIAYFFILPVFGLITGLLILIWFVVRNFKGIRCRMKCEPYPNPNTWNW